MNRSFIQKNIVYVSVVLFLIIYLCLHAYQPGIMYTFRGELRQFGINQQSKTIFPAWLISIVLAILCYLAVRYYVILPYISRS